MRFVIPAANAHPYDTTVIFPGSRENLSAPAVNANPPRGRVSPVSTVNIPGFPDSAGIGDHSLRISAAVESAGAAAVGAGASAASEAGEPVIEAGCVAATGSALAAVFGSFEVASSPVAVAVVAVVVAVAVAEAVAALAVAGALSSTPKARATRPLNAPQISNTPAQKTHDFIPASVPPANIRRHPSAYWGLTRVVKNYAIRNDLLACSVEPNRSLRPKRIRHYMRLHQPLRKALFPARPPCIVL